MMPVDAIIARATRTGLFYMVNYSSVIDTRHLRYFVAVVSNRSFRQAAIELNVSQPPLSRQIQQLEEILGVRLLERNSRGITMTPAGEAFYADARNILALLEKAGMHAHAVGMGQEGKLDVGVFGSAIFDIIPRIILAFREKHPSIEVVLHTMSREEQIKALQDRRIDVGFNRFFTNYPDLYWETVKSQRMIAAIPEEHPLSSNSSISLQDLNDEPLIFYPPLERTGGFSNFLLRVLHSREINANIVQNVEDVVTALSLVSSGIGIALGVESIKNARIPGVSYIDFSDEESISFDLCLIRRNEQAAPILLSFIETALEVGAK